MADAGSDDSETPHYHGHRERLRQRFRDGGRAALADYELLELLLFHAIPRRDVKPLAKQLIKEFRGFAGVLAAYLLEPASEDGLVTWNLLDRELQAHAEYPIVRVRSPLRVAAEELPGP